jgi:prepilin signal peptidase PulO-like enzyme (type II secretory pathway)
MTQVPPPLDMTWFKFLLGLIVGLALGSFVTMLSYRLPRNLSIVTPPSHCPKCKTTLAASDLVPVFSYVSSNGKCRHCGAQIGLRYPLIEFATGILTAIAFVCIGYQPILFFAVIVIITIITAVTMKLEK